MRSDWLPVSASALVVGVMALVFGALLNPDPGTGEGAETIRAVTESGGRWLAMSVMYFVASVSLLLGLPAMLTLFRKRPQRLGITAVAVFLIGVVGTSGYAMLLVFFRALVNQGAINEGGIDDVAMDTGLTVFLYGWIAGFYVGLLLVAVALFLSKRTPIWVPIVLVVFVASFPLSSQVGRVGQVIQLMALAVAFTGIAIAAVTEGNERRASYSLSH